MLGKVENPGDETRVRDRVRPEFTSRARPRERDEAVHVNQIVASECRDGG